MRLFITFLTDAWSWLVPRLRRITTSGRFIPEIDGLRFVAIAAVVAFHLYEHNLPTSLVRHGHCGVDLFFVISGLVLGLPFASQALGDGPRVRLRPYLLRRLTRLEPPYVLALLLFFTLRVLQHQRSPGELLPHLGASLLYVHNLVYGTQSWVNLVAWSLEVEVQFYLAAPLLAVLFTIRRPWLRRLTVVLLCLLAVVLQTVFIGPMMRPAFSASPGRAALSLLNYVHLFLLGFLLADLHVTDWQRDPRLRRAWDLAALGLFPALFWIWQVPAAASPGPGTAAGAVAWIVPLLFPALIFFAYVAAFRGVLARRVFGSSLLTTIGGMCYTIYLLHSPLISVLGRRTPTGRYPADLVATAVVLVPALVIVCGAYFMLIERPCMRKDWPARLLFHLRRRVVEPLRPLGAPSRQTPT